MDAKRDLVKSIENEARVEAAGLIRRIEEEAIEQATQKARHIIGMAIQRLASDTVVEATVSVVELPSDDLKGRIIGREGRNIRALEAATGVDLIIDDTPEAIVISAFEPLRREVARLALEKLIVDGRIHPARIEEIVVEKVRSELWEKIRQEGEATALEFGIPDLHPELIKLLGRLKYRTSYGQNVLQHSKEVAWLATNMAAELGADVEVAKRAGLLHDIGKAIDREMEGTHLELGREVLKKFGESNAVIHGMECHHGDYEPRSLEAVLVNGADALSAARPGRAARSSRRTSSGSRSSSTSPTASRACRRRSRSRPAASCGSSSRPTASPTTRRSGSRATSPRRSRPSCSIPARSR